MGLRVWKTSNLTKDTLLKIAEVGFFVLAATTSPYFLHNIAKKFFKDKLEKTIRARAKKLRELQKRKLISFRELDNGDVRVEISHQGKTLVRQYNLDNLKLVKPARWDRKWRIIIYDIPQYKRRASDAFREKLKDLGLFKLQKSVWISAYECLPELEFLCSVFDINMDECVYHFYADHIPREGEARKFFEL